MARSTKPSQGFQLTKRRFIPNTGVLEAIQRAGSQVEVAERLGVHQSAVHHWLWTSIPRDRVEELCRVFNLDGSLFSESPAA